jgi:hypothetical protein
MNRSDRPRPAYRPVGFSHVLGTVDATTLALSLCFAISTLTLMPLAIEHAEDNAPALYLLAFVFYLPLLLALADRARSAVDLSGLYYLALDSESPPRIFFTGWLKLGGYVAMGGLSETMFLLARCQSPYSFQPLSQVL